MTAAWDGFRSVLDAWQQARPAAPPPPPGCRVLRPAEWDGLPAVTELLSPDGALVLTEEGYDLAVRDTGSGRQRPLTADGTSDQPWRANSQVYSLLPATGVWSPDSRRVVTVRADLTGVPRQPAVDWDRLPPAVRWRPSPLEAVAERGTGATAVLDVRTGAVTWAELPEEVHWVPVRWRPDSTAFVALGVDLRGALSLCEVDAATGAVTVLAHDALPGVFPYLATAHTAAACAAPDVRTAWWPSDRDGDLRLYLVGGDEPVPVTPSGVQLERVAGPAEGGGLLVTVRGLDRDDPYALTPCHVTEAGAFVALPTAEVPRTQGFTVPDADGTTMLHGVLHLPPGFSPGRRYPVVDCMYGGPQTIAHLAPGAHLWGAFPVVAEALAQLGFVTVVLDARGTPGRGRDFQWPDAPDRSACVVADHACALRELAAERPWMDLGRSGVLGTSFGAYHAVRAALEEPDLFRAVVAHAGPYDPARVLPGWFPGALGSSYQDDPDRYARAGVVARAHLLRAELLLLHGTEDANVTLDHTLRLSAALSAAGRHHELVLLPGQRHHLDHEAAVFALEAAGRFLLRHLG